MKDTIMRGVLAGIVVTPLEALLNWLWFWAGLTQGTITERIARAVLVIPAGAELALSQQIVGLISHFMIGLLFAVLISYVIRFSGWDYYLVKGAGFGLLLGIIHLGVLPFLAHMPQMNPVPLAFLHMFDHIIWGLGIAIMLGILSSEKVNM